MVQKQNKIEHVRDSIYMALNEKKFRLPELVYGVIKALFLVLFLHH